MFSQMLNLDINLYVFVCIEETGQEAMVLQE